MKRNKYCIKKSSTGSKKKSQSMKVIKKSKLKLPSDLISEEDIKSSDMKSSDMKSEPELDQELDQELDPELDLELEPEPKKTVESKVIKVITTHQRKIQEQMKKHTQTLIINKVSKNAPKTTFCVDQIEASENENESEIYESEEESSESIYLSSNDKSELEFSTTFSEVESNPEYTNNHEPSIESGNYSDNSNHCDNSNSNNSNNRCDNSNSNKNSNNKERLIKSKVQGKSKSKPNKIIVQLAIKILREIDPKQKLLITEVEEALKKRIHETEDLIEISAIDHLFDSFNTIENQEKKLELKGQDRKIQEKNLKGKRLDKPIFQSRINLDLPKKDRLPDENDRIYKTGKSVYSGNKRGYKNKKLQDKKKVKQFTKFTTPKKNLQKLKEFNI